MNWREQLGAAGLDPEQVTDLVRRALAEDLKYGLDVTTTATIDPAQRGTADVVARAPGRLAGVPVACGVLELFAADAGVHLDVEVQLPDGSVVEPGSSVLSVSGPIPAILTAERTMLNILCQLSGVATLTGRWQEEMSGTTARVRDTRKTVPGLRELQKYAVRCGGGVNHRMGLGDAALIKDNHVAAAGSVAAAYRAVRDRFGDDLPVEVEVDTTDQAREAIAAGADLILLDNMPPHQLRECVALGRASGRKVLFEASGGLSLESAAEVAATGVDYIAVGALTHSAPVLDLGLDLR
ncbi:carboxylating nicotinate-nucleotide diphosphorylase [Cumulibacter soli]|uniref:carboxylating nicotinate-nucleotide diphosphorylase n=1 Tax=Cumulibacter soli TaxID=2546344 RepID=UPI0010673491|nr:carboxylating nicotinate-nucleotide diphosphorylase [Cumulibacter soli]